jgi:stage II sporulation protein D
MSSRPTRTISYPVRVAVIIDAAEVTLKIRGGYHIYALPIPELLKEGQNVNNITIKPTYSGISMGRDQLKIYGVKIKADDAADISINGRRFRGEMDIIRTEDVKLLVINHLDIEDYISGVLYHEISHWWPMEALKAQAIASRTFAIYKSLESKGKDYDLRSDIYSQVYGGKTSEKFRTNKAVESTAGEVLIYKREILPAYFHATCGGHTEDASLLWNTSIAPLRGRPCRYCARSPHFSWTKKIPLRAIEERLNKYGYKIRDLKDIRTSSRDASGRIKTVFIIDSLGKEKIPANKFRLAAGPNDIRSTDFKVDINDGIAVFEGKGWGHGVGMCQWGAYFMAKRGLKAEDILGFYYPGTRIVNLKDIIKR